MNTNVLLNKLDALELKGILPKVANEKIQEFLEYSTKSIGRLFLIVCGIFGATFCSAGIFALISHNWDDFHQHVRGVLSFIPALVALYFYYIAVFKHGKSTVWIEASSLFLMLMIGATMALVTQTYQMNGDFNKFVIVWLCLTIPLFYIARASGIAIFYLILTFKFLTPTILWGFLFIPSGYHLNDQYYLFWLFFIALLPHFYMVLNRQSRKQGFRAIYLGWLIAIFFCLALPFSIKGGFLWWGIAVLLIYYVFGKKYFGENISHLGRPFQTFTLLMMFLVPISFTDDIVSNLIFRYEGIQQFDVWTAENFLFYIVGMLLLVGITIYAVLERQKGAELNRYVIYIPFVFVFLYLLYCLKDFANFDIQWLGTLFLNFYILGFGINALIQGNKSMNVLYMFYGLLLVAYL